MIYIAMANPNPKLPPIEHRFKPGQSGNPKGNPGSLRQALVHDFTKALRDDFEKGGIAAIAAAREKDPMGYVKAVASLMPKQFEQTQPLDDMTDGEIAAGIAFLRSRLSSATGAGTVEAPESPTAH